MRRENVAPIKILLLIFILSFCISSGHSTLSVSSSYYNDYGEISEDISVKNAKAEGKIFSEGQSVELDLEAKPANLDRIGSEQSEIYSSLQASSYGKAVTAESILLADSYINTVVSSEFHLDAKLGPKESVVSQRIDITSRPGYLTYPTVETEESITAGLTLEAVENGRQLFEKQYVPQSEFGDYPVTFGAMKINDDSVIADDNVYMESKFVTFMTWIT